MAPQKALLPLLVTLPLASAWGGLGHTTVAYIAQNFVSSKTAEFAQSLLSDKSSSYLANIATWADTYRYEKEGKFSAAYHFLDALDTPPSSCNVNYARDCPKDGCIVSALANYSSRAVEKSLSVVEQQKAFKWIVHFIGDIHQPLHVENLDVGGNTVAVTFDGEETNLHATWDTSIPQKANGNFSLANALSWAKELTTEIQSGQYKTESTSWLTGLDATDAVDSAMVWASDTNKYVCSTVIPDGTAAVLNKELSGAYYESAIPVVQLQIAKAGYRLAAWLDAVVTNAETNGYQQSSNKLAERGEFKLEPWMEAARQARRDFGGDCGCGEVEHVH